MIAGIAYGLAGGFFQALAYVFSRRFLAHCPAGPPVLFSLSLVQIGVVCLLISPFLLEAPLPPLAQYIGPLAGTAGFFLAAHYILFHILTNTASSVVAPCWG